MRASAASSAPGRHSTTLAVRTVRQTSQLVGEVLPPGDKSVSHRALILNAIAAGTAEIAGVSPSDDVASTRRCLEALGVHIEPAGPTESVTSARIDPLRVHGVGLHGLHEPAHILDAGNSGTTVRLLAGLLAAQPFLSVVTGDLSLRSRPVDRVVVPLRSMGATLWARAGGKYPPMAIHGAPLQPIDYQMPVASAQVKSALLLAALYAEGESHLREPAPSRDHTERLLLSQGASLRRERTEVWLEGGRELAAVDVTVPADLSAAAFWLVAACIHPCAKVTAKNVGMNPGRTGFLEVLEAMGASIRVENLRITGNEPVADVTAESSTLHGVDIDGPLVPRLIDEIPVLVVAAGVAQGRTRISDAAELRVKETDRIANLAGELRKLGARVEETSDGLVVEGGRTLTGAAVDSHGDHRLAMAMAIAGLVARGETRVLGADCVAVSYPDFWYDLDTLAGGGHE